MKDWETSYASYWVNMFRLHVTANLTLSDCGQSETVTLLQRVQIARSADRCNSQTNSVCLPVRPSVTFRCFVQTNEDTILRFSASGIGQSFKFLER